MIEIAMLEVNKQSENLSLFSVDSKPKSIEAKLNRLAKSEPTVYSMRSYVWRFKGQLIAIADKHGIDGAWNATQEILNCDDSFKPEFCFYFDAVISVGQQEDNIFNWRKDSGLLTDDSDMVVSWILIEYRPALADVVKDQGSYAELSYISKNANEEEEEVISDSSDSISDTINGDSLSSFITGDGDVQTFLDSREVIARVNADPVNSSEEGDLVVDLPSTIGEVDVDSGMQGQGEQEEQLTSAYDMAIQLNVSRTLIGKIRRENITTFVEGTHWIRGSSAQNGQIFWTSTGFELMRQSLTDGMASNGSPEFSLSSGFSPVS